MGLETILLVVLILILIGAIPTWAYSRNWGYWSSGGVGCVGGHSGCNALDGAAMTKRFHFLPRPSYCVVAGVLLLLSACNEEAKLPVSAGFGPSPTLPEPQKALVPTVNIAPPLGWPAGVTPQATQGTNVVAFASGLDHPRWLYVLPNGDVLVAETNSPPKPPGEGGIRGWVMRFVMKKAGAGVPSANRITLLRDTNGDGVADQRSVLLEGLYSPFGMALVGNELYVANSDAVVRFPYNPGETRITAKGKTVVALPAGDINHHWTKNLIASTDGSKLYVTVGSNSNVGERGMDVEVGRAAIWEIDRQRGTHRIFASGLRNPNGMAWEPTSGALWTVVNERDEIGNDLVPDYMTSVRDGAFYGWPYSYFGQHVDERVTPPKPDLVAKAIAPDYALGAHTASLGLTYSTGTTLPARFAEGMFIGQHGSWNRRPHSGYKVVFIPFDNGKPAKAPPIDVLTGFLNSEGKAYGRPVGVALDKQGALLVADDVGNVIWRVSSQNKVASSAQPGH
ncbi:PQQ-dependent sugar dehydrogenase [Chitinimonas sp. BJB300]|uniref:PQQ-dependent sugar dehydrogenase n=1 Tax=Chitinimonas sp. BJB300 TaxID=1559339 RepID=UPI000C0C6E00|nr:sorbosone dehydrogenase family protein [Chitinimonas sp. BJB300]PHV09754.1 sorbosone dehydrogenase [Chitinimonas sp. BJB300]TSJ90145.1 sorbosone dehydrogenase family protein [Chitinimonas sp. BJB300]